MSRSPYKKFIKLLSLLCALALLPVFSACNRDDEASATDGEIYHTVSFNTNGGTQIDSIQVRHNFCASRPDDPTRDGYVFRRWEIDGREWHFNTKEVTEDVTINALWISATELFELSPEENGDGLIITDFKKTTSVSTITLPETVNGKKIVGIAPEAFKSTNTDYVSTIIFPKTLTSVGEEAFANTAEVNIELLGTLTDIGEASFKTCALLKDIKLGEGITSIPFMCFYECLSLKTLDIPNTVTTFEENAFEKCSLLTTIVVPASLTTVEDSAFLSCGSLKTVFYKGTEEQLDAIDVADGNEAFLQAKVYFYSENQPTAEGNWWHYDNSGSPVIW